MHFVNKNKDFSNVYSLVWKQPEIQIKKRLKFVAIFPLYSVTFTTRLILGKGLTNIVRITNRKVISQRLKFTFRHLYKNS